MNAVYGYIRLSSVASNSGKPYSLLIPPKGFILPAPSSSHRDARVSNTNPDGVFLSPKSYLLGWCARNMAVRTGIGLFSGGSRYALEIICGDLTSRLSKHMHRWTSRRCNNWANAEFDGFSVRIVARSSRCSGPDEVGSACDSMPFRVQSWKTSWWALYTSRK